MKNSAFYPQDEIREQEVIDREIDNNPSQPAATIFGESDYDNLVKWQLDIKEELVRIEHLLRKHVPVEKDGEIIYQEPKEEDKLFNETGINEIMNILAWYLNKNIILSNFTETEVKLRCRQFLDFLADFIYINYDRFGLNTKEKIKHYPMVVMNIVNTIEAAYNRALNGGERDSLRTARTVSQSEPINHYPYPQGGLPIRSNKKSILKPWTWGG